MSCNRLADQLAVSTWTVHLHDFLARQSESDATIAAIERGKEATKKRVAKHPHVRWTGSDC